MVPLSRADLHQPQLALQGQVLPLAPGDLQPQGGEAIVNELADLGHRRVSQHLHDGHQLGVEVRITRHPVPQGATRLRYFQTVTRLNHRREVPQKETSIDFCLCDCRLSGVPIYDSSLFTSGDVTRLVERAP